MKRKYSCRTPRNYDGTEPTAHSLQAVLPHVLRRVGAVVQERGDLILQAWPEVIGEHLAPMTQAKSFKEGVLTVLVLNATLYSLLVQKESADLLHKLRRKFPDKNIKAIRFRRG